MCIAHNAYFLLFFLPPFLTSDPIETPLTADKAPLGAIGALPPHNSTRSIEKFRIQGVKINDCLNMLSENAALKMIGLPISWQRSSKACQPTQLVFSIFLARSEIAKIQPTLVVI